MHYAIGKHPLSQGKQGTGKTLSHSYYAFKQGLPFFLFSCYEDFKLAKLFGDKTIIGGTIKFQESLFVKAIQSPSVVLFDEINAVSQANTYDFHALLQNRQLFIKDANDGAGKLYILHPDCKIGFAQNPKSAKYIGGQVRASNFLGRCTYISYPEFTNAQLEKALSQRFPELPKDEVKLFVKFYNACAKAIESTSLPFDISIRQLANVIDLYIHGMDLEDAINDGLTSIAAAASQPKSQEALNVIAQATWASLMKK
jgi:MoxR-like ATPase